MKFRNTRDFSPVTPSKANVIRTGMHKDANALFSPKVGPSTQLPSIGGKSPSGGGVNGGKKSTFSKRPLPGQV